MIKAIFFDYDGVLTKDKTGSYTTIRYLSQAAGVDFSKAKEAFGRHNKELTLGTTTHAEIWQQILRLTGRLMEDRTATTYRDWIAEKRTVQRN